MRRVKPISVRIRAPSRGLVTRWPTESADLLATQGVSLGVPGVTSRSSVIASNVRYEDGVICNAPGYDRIELDFPILTGLIAYWKLDEASGTRLDSTVNRHDLSEQDGTVLPNNQVGQVSGKFNSAAFFPSIFSPLLISITVAPLSVIVPYGGTQQFVATGHYSDGGQHDLTSSVSWESSNHAIATVDSAGFLTAVSSGSIFVTATSGVIVGSSSVVISSPILLSIVVTPASPTIYVENTEQFIATGHYSDSSISDLTSLVSWDSSNYAVATIVSGGLATGVSGGSASISAVYQSIIGSTTLSVNRGVCLDGVGILLTNCYGIQDYYDGYIYDIGVYHNPPWQQEWDGIFREYFIDDGAGKSGWVIGANKIYSIPKSGTVNPGDDAGRTNICEGSITFLGCSGGDSIWELNIWNTERIASPIWTGRKQGPSQANPNTPEGTYIKTYNNPNQPTSVVIVKVPGIVTLTSADPLAQCSDT